MAEEDKIITEEPSKEDVKDTTVETNDKEPETPPPSDTKDDDTKDDEEDKDTKEDDGDDGKEKDDIKPEDVDLNNPDEVSNALNKKGIDYNALTEEYMANGKLSDKTIQMLEEAGIPKEMTATYIKGCEAIVEAERNELAQEVGGKEQFNDLLNWCSHNLPKEEIISLNAIRDKFQLKATLRGLKVRMEEKEGKTPEYQKGTGDKATIAGYRSQAEMFEAIKDPKYQKDPAYRDDVQKKIAASREAGIDLGIY